MSRYLISASLLAGTLFAESLPVIIVDSKQEDSSTEVSAIKLNKINIENSFRGNGQISSLLELHPNIVVDDSSQNSETAGEIKPGKISFHNAPFYQNNFQIDGISNDSIIDPTISEYDNPYDVPGNENETFLDLDLIESIKIYDSNIPVKYGNFTGGVIDAKTLRPKGKESFKISYRHTSDSLTKIHVSDKEDFDEANSDSKQPKFDKKSYSMYYITPIDDENGLLFSYSRNESTIPGAYLGGFRDKKRLAESFLLKWSHYFKDDSILDLSVKHSPNESTHHDEYIKDSFTKVKGGGNSIVANYEQDFDLWSFNTDLGLKYSQNTKESLNYKKTWFKSSKKPWGKDSISKEENKRGISEEGGSGNIKKIQKGINYNASFSRNEINLGSFSHKISTGFSANYNITDYNRKENTYYYSDAKWNENIFCGENTVSCLDGQQYLRERRVYRKEHLDVGMFSTDIYIQDKIEKGIFEFTPALRADYNNYLKNLDFSYRFNGSVKPFNNKKTVIFGGFNRYYGKSFLGHKLREARLPHYDEFRDTEKNELSTWGTSADKDSQKYVFSDLDTPYSDERSIGLKQDFDLIKLRTNLKYVHREAKNGFSSHYGDYKVFTMPNGITKGYYKPKTFGNKAYSKSESLSLSFNPTEPLEFSWGNMGYSFSTSWTKSSSNSNTYDDILDDEEKTTTSTTIVSYNGVPVNKNDLDLSSTPKKYNLHLNFNFKRFNTFGVPTNLRLNSIIKYTTSYNKIQENSDKIDYTEETLPDNTIKRTPIDVYEDYKFKSTITLDLKAAFNFKLRKKNNLDITTEITNVFDSVRNIGLETDKFMLGRQIWLGIAYNFK